MISHCKVILPLCALLMLGACDDTVKTAEDKAAEKMAKAMGVDADVRTNADGSKDVIIREGGATVSTGSGLGLPDGFPSDIPAYPGWNIQASAKSPQGFLVHGQSKDKMAAISKFYNDRMTGSGWKNTTTTNVPDMTVLIFEKAGRTANVNIMANEEGSMVQISLPPEG